jgi:hypothetical protein
MAFNYLDSRMRGNDENQGFLKYPPAGHRLGPARIPNPFISRY